jgi:DNA modification methylase
MNASSKVPGRRVEMISTEMLRPAARNPRRHPAPQIEKIACSIETFGFLVPIVVDSENRILAGHGRWEAAKTLGMPTVPVLRVEHLTPAQRRAYRIADNRIGELAQWDEEALRMELQEILVDVPGFDLSATGFEIGEVDRMLLGENDGAASDPADEIPTGVAGETICRLGDLWHLGPHRLLIGDARHPQSYRALLGERRADAVFTDPPYNVAIRGHARRGGRHVHREFPMACGELDTHEFTGFLKTAFELMAAASRPGALHYTWVDWRHLYEALSAGREVYDRLLNVCVWDKETGGMGSMYRSQHELALVWRTKGATHRNNVALGRFGRNRTNIWRHPGANSFGRHRQPMLELHSTVKPTALAAGAILDCTKRGDAVLDPFLGSGTTIVAAAKTGRVGFGMELDPAYGDVIIRRFERYTGLSARHAQSGRSFSEEAEIRSGPETGRSGVA